MTTQHFTGDQVSQWVAGEKPAELAAHLEVCGACSAHVTRFETVLAGFHDGIHDATASVRIPAFEPPSAAWQFAPRWALAGAVAAFVVAVPFYRGADQPRPVPVPSPVVVAEVSDAQLLEQINAQLARHVPGPLEPLESLSYSPLEELTKGQNQ